MWANSQSITSNMHLNNIKYNYGFISLINIHVFILTKFNNIRMKIFINCMMQYVLVLNNVLVLESSYLGNEHINELITINKMFPFRTLINILHIPN